MDEPIVIMDGRARFDVDRATVISAGCESLDDAIAEARERGDDSVVVNIASGEVLWMPEMDGLDE